MNKNIIPCLDNVSKLTEQELINKYKDYNFESKAEAKVYIKLYDLSNNDDSFRVRYDYIFPPKFQGKPTQVDFILLKHNVGAALIEVKGQYENEDLEFFWRRAHNQLKDANYSLHDRINVYNIIIFPDHHLEKEKFFQKHKNDVNGYIVDKKTFDEWVDKNKCIEYFYKFFNEKRYEKPNPKTNETEKELFDFNKYYKQYLSKRDREEENRTNTLYENIESIEDNNNIIMLNGLAGSGKTFVAMNIAIKKKTMYYLLLEIKAYLNKLKNILIST